MDNRDLQTQMKRVINVIIKNIPRILQDKPVLALVIDAVGITSHVFTELRIYRQPL